MDSRVLALALIAAALAGLACVPEITEAASDELGSDSSGEATSTVETGSAEGDGDPGDGDPGDGDPGDGEPGDGDGDPGDGDPGDGDGEPPECTSNVDCSGSNCLEGACVTVRSCKQLDDLDVGEALASGVYELDPDLDGPLAPFAAYCELEVMGGGWTMVLKSDGNLATFEYGAGHWNSDQPFAPEYPDLDRREAKLASYTQVPMTEMLVAMEYPVGVDPTPLSLQYLMVPGLAGGSLFDLVSPGQHVATQVGREAWKGLIPGSSMQANCNLEGLNVVGSTNLDDHRVRIGLIGNDQNNCGSPNSRIGIGGFGDKCGAPDLPTGNFAGCFAEDGDRVWPGFGVVFVR